LENETLQNKNDSKLPEYFESQNIITRLQNYDVNKTPSIQALIDVMIMLSRRK
jgi:hypothetical protein